MGARQDTHGRDSVGGIETKNHTFKASAGQC
jgi:hypothetical protein